jgi:hypothetical protein
MPYALFGTYFRELAERETRSITVLPDSNLGLPAGEYGLLEMYCDERGCDCRRVFLYVVHPDRRGPEAVIAWGWEDVDFYKRWFKYEDAVAVADLKGPVLNFGSPASELAPALLELVRNVLLKDSEYVERIKRHYRMFKDAVNQPRWGRKTSQSDAAKEGKRKKRK